MASDGLWSIGELAERAGATVKTVRYYSDRGLLPEAGRSSGGHRRYGPEALDRIRLIRSLRTLDVPVPSVDRILDREDTLEDVVARQLRELGDQLAALRWRQAALQLLQGCSPEERTERLLLIGTVSVPPGTADLARFWRRWLPPRLPARVVSAVLDAAVPEPPASPAPPQVLAFARLHAFVSRPCTGTVTRDQWQPAAHRPEVGYRPAVLYDGLVEAYGLAAAHLRAGRQPHGGEALDCFVLAHARALGARDTPAFRRGLAARLAADPRIDRYWELAAEVFGPARPTPGAAEDWLRGALGSAAATG